MTTITLEVPSEIAEAYEISSPEEKQYAIRFLSRKI